MPNLIESLGADYCNQRVSGALFLYKGDAHMFQEVTVDPAQDGRKLAVLATKFTGTTEKFKEQQVLIPADEFSGWGALSFPTLGYRQAAAGQVLVSVTRVNGVNRGLNYRDVRCTPHDISYSCAGAFGINLADFTVGSRLALMVLKPDYTPLSEGIPSVLAGKIPAFAMSAEFAVAPAADVSFLEILFRGRRVGEIDERGKVSITVPSISTLWNSTTKESSK